MVALPLMRLISRRALCLLVAVTSFGSIHKLSAAGQAKAIPYCIHPAISISPTFGTVSTGVTISSACSLSGATAVAFGGTNAPFTIQSNGTIVTSAPSGPAIFPGSILPVTVSFGGETIGGDVLFTYGIGQMLLSGPYPYTPGENDLYWTSSAYSLFANPPTVLTFGTASPVLHVSTLFNSSQFAEHPDPPEVLGNQGYFFATLEECSLDATPQMVNVPEGAVKCANWDGNTGYWMALTKQQMLLNYPAPLQGQGLAGQSSSGDLALPAGSAFDVANYDLVHTFRVSISMDLYDTVKGGQANRAAGPTISSPFTAVVVPVAMLQVRALPYAILFAPTGNQSTASFSVQSTFTTNYTLGNSTAQSSSLSFDDSSSAVFSGSQVISQSLGGGQSVGGSQSYGTTESWDTTTTFASIQQAGTQTGQQAMQSTTITPSISANSSTIPGSGYVCAAPTQTSNGPNCAPQALTRDPNWYQYEPFWDDIFYLRVHPQFAALVLGNGSNRYVIYKTGPVGPRVSVWKLAACVTATPVVGENACKLSYPDAQEEEVNGQIESVPIEPYITLTPQEANNLLSLDPFYVGGQGAPIPPTRGTLVITSAEGPTGSISYGAQATPANVASPPQPVTVNVNNTQVTSGQKSGQDNYSTTVTDTLGTNSTAGMTLNLFGATSFTAGDGEKETYVTGITNIYSNSNAVSNQVVTIANVILNDFDNTTTSSSGGQACAKCHGPLPQQPAVNVYLDKIFGGFMFQDTGALPSYIKQNEEAVSVNVIALATQAEMATPRFSDVPVNSPARAAIGILAVTGVMSGYPDGTFRPTQPMTRAQLATSLAEAAHLSTSGGPSPFTDIPSNSTFARAAVAAAGARLISTRSATTFGPTDPVTREDLATSLDAAFKLTGTAPTGTASTKFVDSQSISPSAVNNVQRVIAAGFMAGFPDMTFRPKDTVTRSDAALALFTALQSNPR